MGYLCECQWRSRGVQQLPAGRLRPVWLPQVSPGTCSSCQVECTGCHALTAMLSRPCHPPEDLLYAVKGVHAQGEQLALQPHHLCA